MDAFSETLYGIQNTNTGELIMVGNKPFANESPDVVKFVRKNGGIPKRRQCKVVKLAVVYTVLNDKV